MRGNGLQAQSYVAVADIDRRTADFLLAELRARGVAAYAADSPDPGPSGPVDRLYVDAEAETEVRGMIDGQLADPDAAAPHGDAGAVGGTGATEDAFRAGGLDSDYVDSTFADIVAGFHQGSAPEVGRWSAEEDVDGETGTAGTAGTTSSSSAVPSYIGWDDLLRPEPPAPDPLPDPEDRYVPPPPPPLPRGSKRTRAAWAAVLGGPAVLFAAAIFGLHPDNTVLFLCAVSFLGGFGALVAGLRSDDEEDDGDDGAVV